MPRFKIIPSDPKYSASEIVAPNAAAILSAVAELDGSADVLEGDAYAFSIRSNGDGLWTVFQRPAQAEGRKVQSLR